MINYFKSFYREMGIYSTGYSNTFDRLNIPWYQLVAGRIKNLPVSVLRSFLERVCQLAPKTFVLINRKLDFTENAS